MTKKRLIVDDDYNWVDTITDQMIEVEDAFNLINKLNEENEQLKKQKEFLKKRCDEYWEEAGLNSDYYD